MFTEVDRRTLLHLIWGSLERYFAAVSKMAAVFCKAINFMKPIVYTHKTLAEFLNRPLFQNSLYVIEPTENLSPRAHLLVATDLTISCWVVTKVHTIPNQQLKAAGLFKYVWTFVTTRHETRKEFFRTFCLPQMSNVDGKNHSPANCVRHATHICWVIHFYVLIL